MRLVLLLAGLLAATLPALAQPLPLFDAHLHYNDQAQEPYPLAHVLRLFKENGVKGILANSRPNDGTRLLHEAKPDGLLVVPFVRPYVTRADIPTWFKDPRILELIETELTRGYYRGIGEFHLHGTDAAHPQVRRIVDLSVEKGLWLHAHSDVTAVEILFGHNPKARIIWAHTGFSTEPETVARLLDTYPTLIGELSYRGGITDGQRLTPAWRDLFRTYPDRFLIGSDTWINERWQSYATLIAGYRHWLDQLPRDVAERIAYKNAETMFGGN
jgi:Amidohydrolase